MKNFAIATAKKASLYLIKNFKKDAKLLSKRGVAKEITIKYDKGSDKIIVNEIIKKYQNHNLLTEESGFIDKKSDFTWIIDSLDGSSNFAVGNPFFAVSIALMKGNELVLGVINAPILKEIFVAEKGKGAFLNGKRIHVSGTNELSNSYFVCCEGGDKTNARIAKINYIFHPLIKDLRKLGSAALEGAWVACGRAEVYITPNISPWDIAAAVLLVEEAGGKVTDFKGNEWQPKKSDIILSNGKIHDKVLSMIKKF